MAEQFTLQWDTTGQDDGPVTITAEALDASENILASEDRSFTVDNVAPKHSGAAGTRVVVTAAGSGSGTGEIILPPHRFIAVVGVPATAHARRHRGGTVQGTIDRPKRIHARIGRGW